MGLSGRMRENAGPLAWLPIAREPVPTMLGPRLVQIRFAF